MTAPTNPNGNSIPQTSLYDDANHQIVAARAKNISTDGTTSIVSGDLGIDVEVTMSAASDLTASGTLSAAQPTQGTPVTNATVVLSLGTGQSTFKALLVANAGFTSASTIVVDGTIDGTNWITKGFKVAGSLQTTTVQSITGPGPVEITGNCAGLLKIRVRCSVLGGGESITTVIIASAGTGEVALMSSIPAGNNLIGGVNLQQVGGVATQMSNSDGVSPANILEHVLGLYASGGPVLAAGTPSQLAVDRLRGWLGKATQSGTITSTTAGDTSLTFSVAPKTITPGQMIRLTGSGTTEYVFVSNSFAISASATAVALQSPVVNSGQTTATWDVFNPSGPGTNAMLPSGLMPLMPLIYDPASGNIYAWNPGTADAVNPRYLPEFIPGLYNGSTADRLTGLNGAASIQDFIRYQILKGNGFHATTGLVATGASSAYVGMQAIINNISKNVLIYNVLAFSGSGAAATDARLYQANNATADGALTTNLLTSIKNQQPASGNTSSMSALWGSPASTTQVGSFAGTQVDQTGVPTSATVNILQNASIMWFKAGDVANIAAYVRVTTNGNQAAVSMDWIEF